MKKFLCFLVSLLLLVAGMYAGSIDEGEKSALTLRANSMLMEDAKKNLAYLESHISLSKNDRERRSILYYTAMLEEQMGYFSKAAAYYAEAAAINEPDADGMPAASNAELYIYAARASLGAGDFEKADTYLDAKPLTSSRDKIIIAQKRLYSAWSLLCKAKDYASAEAGIATLKIFTDDHSMEPVRKTVLFTLWYVTREEIWADIIREEYPESPELSIIDGKIHLMGMPFWYLMPRAPLKEAFAESPDTQKTVEPAVAVEPKQVLNTASENLPTATVSVVSEPKTTHAAAKLQVGFFREQKNADVLIEKLKNAGFAAYSYTEQRSSGSTYYVVVVDDNENATMSKKLNAAGFECYPVP